MPITIDQNLVLTLVVLSWALGGASEIILGAFRWKRTEYGPFDVFWGVLTLLFVLLVLVF